MLTCTQQPDGSLNILVNGQLVLNIDELSDASTINLFLTPASGAAIMATNQAAAAPNKLPWTHELLAPNRTGASTTVRFNDDGTIETH